MLHDPVYRAELEKRLAALRSIDKNTPDPVGSKIWTDPQTGEPTGRLSEMFIASVIALCSLSWGISFAQVSPPLSLQSTPLEMFARQPATRLTRSKQVGSLDRKEAHAVVVALVLEDTAKPPDRMRGVRINLSGKDFSDEVYLGEETLGFYKSALDEISRTIPGFRKSARDDLAPVEPAILTLVYSGLINLLVSTP